MPLLVDRDMTILKIYNLKTFRGTTLIFFCKIREEKTLNTKKDCKH